MTESAPLRRWNPYIGPRAFRPNESLPNRQREAQDLTDLIIAERIVLLHAPSGAGKTSLIQAAVLDMLRKDGFRPTTVARVNQPGPVESKIHNRYVYSVALYLLEDNATGPSEVGHLSLKEVLDQAKRPLDDSEVPVLVIDQFEEILTLDPADLEAKEEFFRELGAALADGSWWALFAMREEYMGGLDRYQRLLPGHLRSRYRLDLLTHSQALAAIQKPAEAQRVTFEADAAQVLIVKLATIQIEGPRHESNWLLAPYIEPVVLQIACRELWRRIRAERRDDFEAIETADIEKVDIAGAIRKYYTSSVARVARDLDISERSVRDWFEADLITAQGLRSQTITGPNLGDRTADALRQLEDTHLIRADTRAGTTWYELAHDRLIPAVTHGNYAWRASNLADWQVAAWEWQKSGRPTDLLLRMPTLRHAPLPRASGLTGYEHDFLVTSYAGSSHHSVIALPILTMALTVIIVVETLVIILFILRIL